MKPLSRKRPFFSLVSVVLCAAIAALSLSGCSAKGEESASLTESSSNPQESSVIEDLPIDTTFEGGIFSQEEEEELSEEDLAFIPEGGTSPSDEMDYSRLLARKNQVYTVGSSTLYPKEGTSPKETARYTLMIYMTGSNLESQKGRATFDILEMLDSGLSFEDVNLILYTGGAQTWKSNIPSSYNSVIDLSLDQSEYIVANTEANADMGAPETLSNFVNFATEYYPAEHYSLIFWDHGGGPLWGYGSDELFNADSLLLAEMKTAMDATIFRKDAKLDFVGFDACLMGSYEVMSLWAPYANYFLASEELEPGDGWDYHFLSVLNETSDPEEIGVAIVEAFHDYYDQLKTETYNPDITLSLTDLSKVASTSSKLEELFSSMALGLKTGYYNEIQKSRSSSKNFGVVETRSQGFYYYDLVDLRDFVENIQDMYPSEAQQVLKCLDDLVVFQTANVEHAGGVSMYYPCQNKGQFEKLAYSYKSISSSDTYITFLDGISSTWLYSKSRDWVIPEMTLQENEFVFQLSEDQLENLSSASYTILHLSENGVYSPLVHNVQITADEDGILHIPSALDLFRLRSDSGDYLTLPIQQIEKNAERELYRSLNTAVCDYQNYYSFYTTASLAGVSLSVSVAAGADPVITSLTRNVSATAMGATEDIRLSDWESIMTITYEKIPTYDLSERLLPFSQWHTESSSYYISTLTYNDSFSIEKYSTSDYAGSLVLQLVLEDTNGEKYASDLTPYPSKDFYFKEVDTPLGLLTYYVCEDHAEAYEYIGSDTEVTVDREVDGKPVTVISANCFSQRVIGSGSTVPQLTKVVLPDTIKEICGDAFFNCRYLTDLQLPDSLKSIGTGAFSGCGFTSLVIPNSVTSIDKGAFDSCASLVSITLPDSLDFIGTGLFSKCSALQEINGKGTKGYQLVDGALLDETGTVLLAYPAALTGSYTVPEGVIKIGFSAFSYTSLSEVILPEGLLEIGNFAFFGFKDLAVPVFPDSLTTIGGNAFSNEMWSVKPEETSLESQIISLGPNIVFIGSSCFNGYIFRTFEVDQENPFYLSKDGNLLNKAGDTLLQAALDPRYIVEIPEGIIGFSWNSLRQLQTINIFGNASFHLVIPDTVQRITGSRFSTSDFTIHASPGSYAQSYAEDVGIRWDQEMDMEYTITTVSTEKGVLYARVYQDHAAILLYVGEDEILTLPETIEGQPVTILGNGEAPLFYSAYSPYPDLSFPEGEPTKAESVTELNLPSTLKVLAAQCLSNAYSCSSSITIPSGVSILGDHCLPSRSGGWSLPKHLEYIGALDLGSLDPIYVSPETAYISPQVYDCKDSVHGFIALGENEKYSVIDGSLYSADGKTLLKWASSVYKGEVTLPEGIEVIGPYALSDNVYSSIIIPEGVISIEESAFSYSYQLASVSLPSTLKTIGPKAFYSSNLTSLVTPDGLLSIQNAAFRFCEKLEELTLNEGLSYLGDYAFAATNLTSISLPDSLTYVGDSCFAAGVYDLIREGDPFTLHLGPNLMFIGAQAFSHLPIGAFDVSPDNLVYSSREGFLYDATGHFLMVAPILTDSSVTVPDNTLLIDGYAFYFTYTMKDLYLPESVRKISSIAFNTSYKEYAEDGSYEFVNGYWFTAHVPKGSFAERYMINYDVPYVAE